MPISCQHAFSTFKAKSLAATVKILHYHKPIDASETHLIALLSLLIAHVKVDVSFLPSLLEGLLSGVEALQGIWIPMIRVQVSKTLHIFQ